MSGDTVIENPVFDFDDISWVDEKKKSVALSRLGKAEQNGDVEGIASAFEDIEEYLTKCLVTVPRDWLVKTAPETIDWADKSSFRYIKGIKFQDLLRGLREAQSDVQKK